MFKEIISSPATNFAVSPIVFFMAVSEAFILGLVIVYIYRKKHYPLSQKSSFIGSLTLMAPLIATIMIFIGSNLALSIGMVGALSIVRFRTVIKDPLDMMYLFILIAIGLGAGTQNYLTTLMAGATLTAILFYVHPKVSRSEGTIVLARGKEPQGIMQFSQRLKEKFPSFSQDRFDSSESFSEVVLSTPLEMQNLDQILAGLKVECSLQQVTLMKNKSEA